MDPSTRFLANQPPDEFEVRAQEVAQRLRDDLATWKTHDLAVLARRVATILELDAERPDPEPPPRFRIREPQHRGREHDEVREHRVRF